MDHDDSMEPESVRVELVKMDDRAVAPVPVDRQASALATAAQAEIMAMVQVARMFPRSMAAVQDRVRLSLQRPSLAEKAVYRMKRGRKKEGDQWVDSYVEGLSIRAAELAREAMGNITTSDTIIADDARYRTVKVRAMDWQSMSGEERTVLVSKTVERRGFVPQYGPGAGKEQPPDREVIGSRRNSEGHTVYICIATEDELVEAQNRLTSKARRNCILALVPANVKEDMLTLAKAVARSSAAANRQATIKELSTAFLRAGAKMEELAEYLGHPLEESSADVLAELATLRTAIAEGETTWRATIASRREAQRQEAEPEPPAATPAPAPSARRGGAAAGAAVDRATGK